MFGFKKRSIVCLSVFGIVLCLISGCAAPTDTGANNSSSVASSAISSSAAHEAQSSASDDASADELVVTVAIDATAAEEAVAAASDIDAAPRSITLPSAATAYDALVACDVAIEGTPSYVTGIAGVAAGAVGPSSGWTYYINGEMPSVAADQYELADGDAVVWKFVTSWE